LIFRMVVENPTWGAPRIHGELLTMSACDMRNYIAWPEPATVVERARDGTGDLVGMYGKMDRNGGTYGLSQLKSGSEQLSGPPWQIPSAHVENSFIFVPRAD